MILTDEQIITACTQERDGILIEPFEQRQVQPAFYDLRVGKQAAVSSEEKLIDLASAGFVQVRPGDFVIVTTYEKLSLDASLVGRFGLTSSFARKGLIATAGPQVDPGFRGRLLVGLTNLSSKPITLSHKAVFLSIEFHRLERPVTSSYSGPYQDREELTQEDIAAVMEREYMSQPEMMRTLEALVTTTKNLEGAVKNLEKTVNWRMPVMTGIILAVIMALFTTALTLLVR